jgi:outer membrane protein OmpA-like peptidoglycan-associated protein
LSTQPRPPGQPGTLAAELHFDTGKSDLTSAAIAQLDEVFFTLRDKPDTGVLVQGHTDSTGSADFNESLSQERANVVKDFLVGRGISADRIVTKGFGETEPVASNDTCENRARNRRADVTLEITTLRETP